MQTYDTYHFPSTALRATGCLVLALLACGPGLREPEAPPVFPIEGLWLGAPEGADPAEPVRPDEEGVFLFISSPGAEGYPYSFQMLRYVRRELAFSGRRLYLIERKGLVRTSAREVLLHQRHFRGAFLPSSAEGEFWPVSEFGGEEVDRDFDSAGRLDLLEFQHDGLVLAGDEYVFRRALARQRTPEGETSHVTEPDIGIVLQTSAAGDRASALTFSPALAVRDARRQIFRDEGESARSAGTARVTSLTAEFFGLELLSGEMRPGDAVLMPDWQPARPERRRLSREEVLERLRRGEPVPREDLIRVLGEDAAP